MKRWPLIASFVLFIALCASVAYWAMQLLEPPLRPIAAAPPSTQAPPDMAAAAALLGGRGNMAVASNFTLQGVVMSGSPAQSIAILTADGKPPKAVRVGSEIVPGVTVKEVQRGYVMLSDGGALQRVELPMAVDAMGAQGRTAAPVAVRAGPATAPPPTPPLKSSPEENAGASLPMRTAPAAPPTVVVSPPPSRPSAPAPNQPSNPMQAQQQPPAPSQPQAPVAQPSAPETANPAMPAAPTPAPAATPSATPSAAATSGATGLPGQNAPGTANANPATSSPPPQ